MEKGLLPNERLIVGMLTCVAVLTFFFPVLTLQVPILGNQNYAGYDVVGQAGKFENTLQRASSTLGAPAGQAKPKSDQLPASVQVAWLTPLLIILSSGFALMATLATFAAATQVIKFSSMLGALAAVGAMVHVAIINADLHAQFRLAMKMAAQAREAEPNQFMMDVVTNVFGNSFQLKPGTGLYVLAICLACVAVITYGRVLVRFGLVPAPAGRTQAASLSQ